VLWGIPLGAYALYRTFRPLRFRPGRWLDLLAILAEVGLSCWVVDATGFWPSPYTFCLATAIVAAGFARGAEFAIPMGVAAAVSVAIPFHVVLSNAPTSSTTIWGSELVLIGMITGYARRLFGLAEARAYLAQSQIERLSEANDLLVELHHVAQTLPASLDLNDTVASTVSRLEEVFSPDSVAVLLWDSSTRSWETALAQGVRLPPIVPDEDLPRHIADAVNDSGVLLVRDLQSEHHLGLTFSSRAALYAPLRARGELVGLLAIEHHEPRRFSARDTDLLEGLAEQAALAIDNARWFARLRTLGADEERTRIARDLHDRVGSSLAYLGFELDRIASNADGTVVQPDLAALRNDVRSVVTEMRDTLYDLRTDVAEDHDLAITLEEFLARVRERTHVETALRYKVEQRLPLRQEREMWRIAREAITNASKHAKAKCISVSWKSDSVGAVLEISDDGIGLLARPPGRLDSYGMQGMRERATALGATLDIESKPGKGVTVRCRLKAQ
jgi:signal transduction histidine kinase